MPHRRHALSKRRVTLLAAAAFALTRAYAYAPFSDRARSGLVQEPIMLATADGRLLDLYATLWAAVGIVCLAHIPRGRLRIPMATITGMMLGWGVAWGLGWAFNPHTAWWQTAFTYLGPAVMIGTLSVLVPHKGLDDPPEAP